MISEAAGGDIDQTFGAGAEAYYAYAIDKNFAFTADYQLIANPAYNADRGPVSIFSGRLHGEF